MPEAEPNASSDPMSLAGRTAIVTGGAGGIGVATASALAGHGARVVVVDRYESEARAVSSTLGHDAIAVPIDLADVSDIRRGVAEIASDVGLIDILVNNAGIFGAVDLLEVTESDYDRLFAVNTRGMFFMLQAVARHMTRQSAGGVIVNVASQAGRRGEARSSVYAATKSAAISFTQSAALALISQGVRVNAVAPGVVDTPMWESIDRLYSGRNGMPLGSYTAEVTNQIPIQRLATAEDVARVILFLASPASSYVVGQTFNVDGGSVLG